MKKYLIFLIILNVIFLSSCTQEEEELTPIYATYLEFYDVIVFNETKLENWEYRNHYHQQCIRGSYEKVGWQLCGDELELPLNCTIILNLHPRMDRRITCHAPNSGMASWDNEYEDVYIDMWEGPNTMATAGEFFSDFDRLIEELGYDPNYLEIVARP